ncbi:hypothetical protein OJF2_31570 [Aquisphaera giovannonii]|uniref:Uncharacterized protein n=1 Tax=Aquisphaera giovannonii TaxID=406548 RepID=A0A5B9W1Z0_9BACT|nr:hypothetical protein OJF2_31570 [Aquisphaera giovannonii]
MLSTIVVLGFLSLQAPSAPAPGTTKIPLLKFHHRAFRIPFVIDREQQDRIATIRLYVSTDGGTTWTFSSETGPSSSYFVFRSAGDGIYCFATQTVTDEGETLPEDVEDLKPVMRIWVETSRRSDSRFVRRGDFSAGAVATTRGTADHPIRAQCKPGPGRSMARLASCDADDGRELQARG